MQDSVGFRLSRAYLWLTTPKRDYKAVDSVVVAYCGFLLIVQVLFQVSPCMTFLATTPFYSIQTYWGLFGGLLIIVDFLTTKKIWQSKFHILLYAILVLAALASVRTISYGVKENLFKLCWAAIQFVLVYSCAYRFQREQLKKYIKALFFVLLAIWFVCCCISLYQYVNQIGYRYVVNPLAKDSSATRQGFYDNRLFGIFYTLNHATFISLQFFLIGLFYIMTEKKRWVKILLICAEVALLCHIILSGSRSAAISLFAAAFCFAWCLSRNWVKRTGWRKALMSVVLSVVVTVGCLLAYQGLKYGLTQVPYLKAKYDYHLQMNSQNGNTKPIGEEDVATATEPEKNEDILDREGLEEDASNGRISIWEDYVSLYREIGLLGLSPGNYMPYILENHPDLYIVDYIKHHYPDKYDSGIIYHVHSGYVMVYVSAGILGLLCLAVFILLCLICLGRHVLNNPEISRLLIGALLIVVTGALAAVFDEGLFFQNNPHTTIFWFALGLLMKECTGRKKVAG